ncbi:MAG: CHAD domain-containing protein, partial [Pseudomonadota bacterium]|nr:CHAD domain-containing protein [Pseudomonadota bacterium]
LDDIDLRISTMSKAARGFVLVTGAEPPTVKAEPTILPEDASTADAFTQIAVRCLAQIVRNEACALKGVDIEGIHQMRVGLRRLRSLISSFGGLLTSDESHRLRGELCWLAGELGPVRDWDVFISETMKRYAAQPALRPSTIHIAGMAERARGEARSRAEKAIRSQRYTRLLLDLGCWLDGGDWRNGVPDNIADASMRQTVAVWLAARLAKVRLAGYKPKKLTDNGRHALRVQIKKLRYASEFFRSLFPAERGDSFIARVVDVQSVLGQINDAVITRELIAYLGARAGQRLDDSIRILMSEAESERMERIKRLPKVWKKLKKNESFWN